MESEIVYGLTGYYFINSDFAELVLIETTDGAKLGVHKGDFSDIPDFINKEFMIVQWSGLVKFDKDGIHNLCVSSASGEVLDYDIKINDHVIDTNYNDAFVFEKDVYYNICIQKNFNDPIKFGDFSDAFLSYKLDDKIYTLDNANIKTHSFSDTTSFNFIPNKKIKSDTNQDATSPNLMLFADIPVTVDTDNDGIPDDWEVNGYTVINQKVLKWEDSFAEKGFKKFVSNPFNAHTANDPYTDYEKASGNIDKAVLGVAQDPLVVAFPSISVSMERLVVSNNNNVNQQQTTSNSKTTTSSVSQSTTTTLGLSATVGVSGFLPSFSATLSTSVSTANSVTDTTSVSKSNSFTASLGINTGQSAFINPNIRYRNFGTAPIYNVKPTTSIIINNETVASVQAQPNQIGNFLSPGEEYPRKGLAPLALNTFDQFSSHPISINYDQLQSIDKNEPVILETDQFSGDYLTITTDGSTSLEKNDWNKWMSQIISTSAYFIYEDSLSGEVLERRVVAKDYNDPNDATPSLTLREALIKAYNLSVKNDDLYLNNTKFSDKDMLIVCDPNTRAQFESEVQGEPNKSIFDTKITRGMKLLFKAPIHTVDFSIKDNFTGGVVDPSDKYKLVVSNESVFLEMIEDKSVPGVFINLPNLTIGKKYMLKCYMRTGNSDQEGDANVYLGSKVPVHVTSDLTKVIIPFVASEKTKQLIFDVGYVFASKNIHIIENVQLYSIDF